MLEDGRSVPRIIEHKPSNLLNLGNLRSAEKGELGSDIGMDSPASQEGYESDDESPIWEKSQLKFQGFVTPRRGPTNFLNAFNFDKMNRMDHLEIHSVMN